MQMITCPNCGAEIERDEAKCPYCDYINMEGAEKQFRADLDEIKTNMKELKKEPGKAFRKGLFSGAKAVAWTIGILLALTVTFLVLVAVQMRDKPKMILSPQEEAEASAYRVLAGEQLETAYEEKDIARMAQIYDQAFSVDRISLWGDPHYETAYAASCYQKLQKLLADHDADKWSSKEAEELTYYCFVFYYREYGEDGAELFDDIRTGEIIPLLETRLGFTEADLEQFRDAVTEETGVNRVNVQRATRKYYKNYR